MVFLLSIFYINHNYYKRVFILFVCLCIICFVGLRYNSIDYFSYMEIFDVVSDFEELTVYGYPVNWAGNIEPGFALSILFFKSLNLNFYVFIFIFSFVSICIKFVAFKKMSPYIFITLLIYLSDNLVYKDMGQIRNAMASGIILLSIYYLYNKRNFIFFTLILFATSIHFFSILGFLIYIFKSLRNKKILISLLLISLIISFLGGIVKIIIPILEVFNLSIFSKIMIYANSTDFLKNISIFNGTNILQIIIVVIILTHYDKLIKYWKFNEILIPIFLLSSMLMFLFIDFEIIWGRTRDMFVTPLLAVILPSFLLIYKNKFLTLLPILFYTVLWFYLMIPHRNDYQTILQFLF